MGRPRKNLHFSLHSSFQRNTRVESEGEEPGKVLRWTTDGNGFFILLCHWVAVTELYSVSLLVGT